MTNPDKTSDRVLTGKCSCGTVQYAVMDQFVYALNCHCSDCRRVTGAAFKSLAGIERDKLHLTRGDDSLMIVGVEEAGDIRCKRCGSFLYSIVREGKFAHVAMGTLTDNPAIRPGMHIFVGSKAPWFTITDDLPQYQEHEI